MWQRMDLRAGSNKIILIPDNSSALEILVNKRVAINYTCNSDSMVI